MGSRRRRARRRPPELDRDDRLPVRARPFERFEELRPIPAPLDVEQDRLRIRVLGEERGAVAHVHVRLVAGGEHVAERLPALAREHVAERPERPALAHEPDRPRLDLLAERGMERPHRTAPEVHHPHAVRSHEPDPRLAGEPGHRLLGGAFADLREAGREHQKCPHSLVRALAQHLHHRPGRDRADREVHRMGDVRHARERGQPLDRLRARVDRIDAALEAVREQRRDRPAADLRRRGRGAEHRDGAGAEERLQGGEVDRGTGGGRGRGGRRDVVRHGPISWLQLRGWLARARVPSPGALSRPRTPAALPATNRAGPAPEGSSGPAHGGATSSASGPPLDPRPSIVASTSEPGGGERAYTVIRASGGW